MSKSIFRHASVSSTYPCQSVGTFEFLSKVCSNPTIDTIDTKDYGYTECSNLVADMVNALEVN